MHNIDNISEPYMFQVGDMIHNTNPSCQHYGSKGIVMSVDDDEFVGPIVRYRVTNTGDTFKPGMTLDKTIDQLALIPDEDWDMEMEDDDDHYEYEDDDWHEEEGEWPEWDNDEEDKEWDE
jgi:inner membrane protein involved in colicin E2 resistance